MILKLFRIRKTVHDIRDAKNNPTGFVADQTKDAFRGIVFLPVFCVVVCLALLYVAGFQIGDGNDFFKVLFFIFLIPSVLLFSALIFFWRIFRRIVVKVNQSKESRSPLYTPARDVTDTHVHETTSM